MDYALLVLSILFAALNNVFLHKYNEGEGRCNIFTFNAFVSVLWVGILLIVGVGFHGVALSTVGYGVLYGSMIALFLLFKMLALGSGPVSVTALIGCCSLIVPTLAGVIVWKERVGILQIAGLILLFVALFLCVDPKSDVKISKRWIVYCLVFFPRGRDKRYYHESVQSAWRNGTHQRNDDHRFRYGMRFLLIDQCGFGRAQENARRELLLVQTR